MSFEDYVTLVGYRDGWHLIGKRFGGYQSMTSTKLKAARVLRNDLFHFKKELESQELRILRDTRDWILGLVERTQTTKAEEVQE
jgi:hypothetical protein